MTESPGQPKVRSLSARLLLLAALVAYGAFLWWHMGAVAGAADTSGYVNAARLLLEGNLHPVQRIVGELTATSMPSHSYVPLGMSPDTGDWSRMVPSYPMGLPVLIAGFSYLVGLKAAPGVVLWLSTMLLPLVVQRLARACGLGGGASLLVAAVTALSPLVFSMALLTMSDVPCALACLLALLFAWKSRGAAPWSLAGGLFLGLAVLIRPTSVLLGLPLLVAAGFSWRRWFGLGFGSLPGVLAMFGFNWHLYHNPLLSGYGSVFEIFGWANVAPSLRNYVVWGLVCFSPLALTGPLAPAFAELRQRPLVLALWLWALLLAVFYSFYPFTWMEWWYLRFLLPAGPGMAILGCLVFLQLARPRALPLSLNRGALALCCLLLLWCLGWTYKLGATKGGRGELTYTAACDWALREIPENAIIVCGQCSGAVYHYCPQLLVRRDSMREGAFDRIRKVATAQGRPVYAMMYAEEAGCLDEPGLKARWERVGDVRHISFWRLAE